jgi:hypothetical protein
MNAAFPGIAAQETCFEAARSGEFQIRIKTRNACTMYLLTQPA